MTSNTISDGVYVLYPEGGAYELVKFRGGKVRSFAYESNMQLHRTAGDGWAVPQADIDGAAEVPADVAEAVRLAWCPDRDPSMLTVCVLGDAP